MNADKAIEWVAIWVGIVGAVCAVSWRLGWQPSPTFVISLAAGVAVGLVLTFGERRT